MSFKQTWQLMKEDPLVSVISVLATGLSIAMTLVVVLFFQVSYAGFSPESNRGRMLYVLGTQAKPISGDGAVHNSSMSAAVARACFYSLSVPEAVTAITRSSIPASLPGRKMFREYDAKATDHNFWRVFNFSFVSGEPFSEADFLSGIPRAVISTDVAQKLFGGEEAIGRTIILNDKEYVVCGTVRPVSRKAEQAYADVWFPYSSDDNLMQSSRCDGICGLFSAVILARSTKDFGAIREELAKTTAAYNESKRDMHVDFLHNPITRLDVACGATGYMPTNMSEAFLRNGFLILLMLLIPALNITGFIMSAARMREAEMGIRKAFGASRVAIIFQILYENMLTSAIGGVLGLALSLILFRLASDFMLTAGMLLKPGLFAAALLFVLILNLLSAGVPAFSIARKQIVASIRGHEL